ncbi:precorrin-3B synthase [Microcoleus sp. LEGE 07076]|uniref:precorrin-3B synthase n=1 Tax=Microcoleus sp. LEGE 07076 TaxID=915322 RepID=UPI0018830858|nr:precorrin-3B synthase [Microcoleus sp. LEGE 07076]MBE9188431.1 precorrin-3B synthase [Microcoleus sp. LEGE 07076]
MLSLSELPACPGLFCGSRARDGILSRMRIPGGILTVPQCRSIANLVDRYSTGCLQITNRANLQIRELHSEIAAEVWQDLQELGLASRRVEVDSIRNIMASPTAGIDRQQLLDTRPLVAAWDNYLQTHPELSELSAKFSIGFDGGESVSIRDFRNDILLAATEVKPKSSPICRLFLNGTNTGITVKVSQCISVLAALANAYLEYTKYRPRIEGKKPRLRQLLGDWGVENYLKRVEKQLPFAWQKSSIELPNRAIELYGHLGIHPQQKSGFSYLGIAVPLGRLESQQLRNLAKLAQNWASSTLRLTPWQNLLISDIPNTQLFEVKQQVADLGLHSSATHLDSCLVACAGSSGCASAMTDTQSHALAMVKDLAQKLTIDRPINIHFSGCEKSCAQHSPIDLTLVGIQIKQQNQTIAGYDIYAGTTDSPFGRKIFPGVRVAEIASFTNKLLQIYQRWRSPHESLGEFVDRSAIDQLQQLLNPKKQNHK